MEAIDSYDVATVREVATHKIVPACCPTCRGVGGAWTGGRIDGDASFVQCANCGGLTGRAGERRRQMADR